jgi:hypothetical protein
MKEFLKGALITLFFGMLYMVLTFIFPPCDKHAKNAALAKYNQRMQDAGLPLMDVDALESGTPDQKYNWNTGVEAAIQLQRDLKACHCDGSDPVEAIKKKIGAQ